MGELTPSETAQVAVKSSPKKTVSLVLGSGGARGMAHIGVIRWLEEHDYDIRSIAGASIGALVGGIHAAGKLDVFEDWARALTPSLMVSLLDLTWERGGLVKGDKIINTLKALVGPRSIEELPIRFTAVAAELEGGKEVWLSKGSLFGAIRASISLPLFFTPYDYQGGSLIDGGVLNPVPIAPTFSDQTDLTIAVSLAGIAEFGATKAPQAIKVVQESSSDLLSLVDKIQRFIGAELIDLDDTPSPEEKREQLGSYDVAYLAFDAMQATIARQKLAAYPPDRLVEISRNSCRMMEFDRSAEMIELGYQAAANCLQKDLPHQDKSEHSV